MLLFLLLSVMCQALDLGDQYHELMDSILDGIEIKSPEKREMLDKMHNQLEEMKDMFADIDYLVDFDEKSLSNTWNEHLSDFRPDLQFSIVIAPGQTEVFVEPILEKNQILRGCIFVIVDEEGKVLVENPKAKDFIFNSELNSPGDYEIRIENGYEEDVKVMFMSQTGQKDSFHLKESDLSPLDLQTELVIENLSVTFQSQNQLQEQKYKTKHNEMMERGN